MDQSEQLPDSPALTARRNYYKERAARRLAASQSGYKERLRKARRLFALSAKIEDRIASQMAVAGFGVDDLVAKTGISRADARRLVLGAP